jgi:hypothetical protein
MPILNDIATILHEDFKCDRLLFEEKDAGMKIDVDSSGCQCIVYKYDKKLGKEYKGGLFPFFAKNEGVCKVSDYIVFAEHKRTLYCLIIELKKGKSQTFPQLLAAKEFVKYIVNTLNRVTKKTYTPKIRLISIHGINLRKKKTTMMEVQYDQNSHCIVKSNLFKVKLYLT